MGVEKELKKEVRVETGLRLGRTTPTRDEVKDAARQILEAKLKQKKISLEPLAREQLIDAIGDDLLGLGPIESLMHDEAITEIMINGPFKIYVEKDGKKLATDKQFDDDGHLRTVLEKMLTSAGRRLDESLPYVDLSLENGARVNAIIAPVAVGGATVTIRKFLDTLVSLDDLVRLETINNDMAEFLQAAIHAKLNILFSGATGSGKTTTLGVLSTEIATDERLIVIEDALELKLNQEHVVRLLTRNKNIEGKGEITIRQLFSNSLRMRPSRIILGEIRGEEALDYLQAMNSGHHGTLAVLHASTPVDAVGRLETMAMYAGLNLPLSEIRRQISSGLNLILQHEQLADGSRKVTHVTELCGMKDGSIIFQDVFRYEIDSVSENGKVAGQFRRINQPVSLERFRQRGVRWNENTPPA